MIVFLSKYRNHWVSPYTVLEKLIFWRKVDILNLSPRQEKFCDVITPLCNGWLKLMDTIHPRVQYVKIDRWDTWDMRSTLAPIIVPMLKQLKETKHGIPAAMIHGKNGDEEIPFEEAEKKWDEALDCMIWSFETEMMDNPDERFFKDGKYDHKGHQQWRKRQQKGFDLFGKHYLSLWDQYEDNHGAMSYDV